MPDDPDDPINRYVQEQLKRIRSNEAPEYSEELSAQTDGADDDEGTGPVDASLDDEL